MKEKLRKYVEDMVRDIPKTRNVVDLKEEIIGNMEERYDDLRAEGYGEQDAFDCTINAMGDIRSLFEEENLMTSHLPRKTDLSSLTNHHLHFFWHFQYMYYNIYLQDTYSIPVLFHCI